MGKARRDPFLYPCHPLDTTLLSSFISLIRRDCFSSNILLNIEFSARGNSKNPAAFIFFKKMD